MEYGNLRLSFRHIQAVAVTVLQLYHLQYHPDGKKLQAEKDLANKQMMVINNAYKVLKDEESRQLYDKQRLQATPTAEAVASAGSGDGYYARGWITASVSYLFWYAVAVCMQELVVCPSGVLQLSYE